MVKILFIAFLIISANAFGQRLPEKQMKTHLILSGEISNEKEAIFTTKICGNDSIAIYYFGNSSPHGYYFLLLKNSDRYLILNGDNVIKEWEELDKIYSIIQISINYKSVESLMSLYIHNQNYHKTPPMPSLKSSESVDNLSYPPRKIIGTKPFYFHGD